MNARWPTSVHQANELRGCAARTSILQLRYALLHMDDVCALAESPAAELPFVIQFWPREPVLFREGVGLATALELIARSLLDRLPPANGGKVMFMRATLQGVALDHESVASIAGSMGALASIGPAPIGNRLSRSLRTNW
jgi:hypothetical protein